MKKILLLATLVLLVCAVVYIAFADLVGLYDVSLLVPRALDKKFPMCFNSPQCTKVVYKIDVQVKQPTMLIADLYGREGSNGYYARVIRIKKPNYWVWGIHSDSVWWYKSLKKWVNDNPTAILSKLNRIDNISTCEVTASALLTSVTNDAGTMYKCPYYAVTCPDKLDTGTSNGRDCKVRNTYQTSQIIKCGDLGANKGGYYLKQTSMQGYIPINWTDIDGGTTGTYLRDGSVPVIDPKSFEDTDAAITKYCPPAPIGATCP
jgi:hypothetical protein